MTIQNLIYAKNGRLLDYWSRDDLVIPRVVQVKAEQTEIPPVVYNEQTHKYRYKVRRVYKRPSKSNPYDQNKTNIILNKIYISELIFT